MFNKYIQRIEAKEIANREAIFHELVNRWGILLDKNFKIVYTEQVNDLNIGRFYI